MVLPVKQIRSKATKLNKTIKKIENAKADKITVL